MDLSHNSCNISLVFDLVFFKNFNSDFFMCQLVDSFTHLAKGTRANCFSCFKHTLLISLFYENLGKETYQQGSYQRGDYWQLSDHPKQPTRYALSSNVALWTPLVSFVSQPTAALFQSSCWDYLRLQCHLVTFLAYQGPQARCSFGFPWTSPWRHFEFYHHCSWSIWKNYY